MAKQFLYLTLILTTVVPVIVQAQALPGNKKDSNNILKINDTLLLPRIDSLRQVTVTAARNNLQVEKGRIVMNLSNSTLTAGSSAFDLLKKMPGVSVGQDDNITLLGTQGVNVLIDGKMNYLSGKQLADLLKGLNGSDVSRIELLTTPPAEFDAAGNAGIINIVTSKRMKRGYAIDLRSGLTRSSNWIINENITASFNTRRLSLYGSFDYNTPHRQVKGVSGNEVQENDTLFRLERSNTSRYKIKFYTYKLGADWRINEHHQLSAFYHGYFDDFTAPKEAAVYRYDVGHRLNSVVQTNTNIIEPYHYDAANIAWTWNLDSAGKKINTEGHYISYRNLSDALMSSVTTAASTGTITAEHALRSHQPGYITIRLAKTDIEWPYKDVLFKGGFKYAWVSNDNNYRFDSLIDGSFKEAVSMSNHFLYDERVAAAYMSASKKIKNISIIAGLRVEHTDAKGYTIKDDFMNRWKYTNYFPSISVDHELKRYRLNFSISRRINRPTYSDLNPVRWYTDQYYYYSGNPALVPEMAWLFSAGVTFPRKYIFTATYGLRSNYMTRRLLIDSAANAVKSQTANFGNMQRLDFLFSAPFSAGIWSMQVAAGVNYSLYPFPQVKGNATASRWASNIQVQQQVKLPAGLRFELSAFFYSRELWGIYLKDNLFYADAGMRKSFLNDKLLLQLTFADLLRTYRLKGISQSNATNYRYYDRPDSHRIGISVSYHIGGKLLSKKTNRLEEQERL